MEYAAGDHSDVRREVAAAAREACRLQLTSSQRGVISARSPGNGLILTTGADVMLGAMQAEDICLVNPSGEVFDGTDVESLPAELDLHLKVFLDRSDVNSLVHLYPPHACEFADRGELFQIADQGARREIGEFIRVLCRECPSRFTGLCACWTDIRQSASGAGALLVKDDGIVVLAQNLETAIRNAELIEQAASQAAD